MLLEEKYQDLLTNLSLLDCGFLKKLLSKFNLANLAYLKPRKISVS